LLHCDPDGVDSVIVEQVRKYRGDIWNVTYSEWLDDGYGGPPRALKTPARPYTREQCTTVYKKWMKYLRSDG
ncbi:MAG: hypothetical protein LC687_08220, partial [Actinobacteria bacterium]|nr:hypothetical protein [Actinomycetota bacterium]